MGFETPKLQERAGMTPWLLLQVKPSTATVIVDRPSKRACGFCARATIAPTSANTNSIEIFLSM